MRFMDIRKRVYSFPRMGDKAMFVAVPTTAGTGSEVTPFAVITDERTGMKYPLADYELMPDVAVIDAELMMNIPKGLTSCAGIDSLSHALEAVASVMASDFTNGIAKEAIRLIFEYLPDAYTLGAAAPLAREKMAACGEHGGYGVRQTPSSAFVTPWRTSSAPIAPAARHGELAAAGGGNSFQQRGRAPENGHVSCSTPIPNVREGTRTSRVISAARAARTTSWWRN